MAVQRCILKTNSKRVDMLYRQWHVEFKLCTSVSICTATIRLMYITRIEECAVLFPHIFFLLLHLT